MADHMNATDSGETGRGFFSSLSTWLYILPGCIIIISCALKWHMLKRRQEQLQAQQVNGNPGQTNQQNIMLGSHGFFRRMFWIRTPPPVRPQTTTNNPQPSTDPFSRPSPESDQQQTTQYSEPFNRPPPPPYPGNTI